VTTYAKRKEKKAFQNRQAQKKETITQKQA